MNAPYIIAAWLLVFTVLGVYAVTTILRGRRLAKRVPVAERRWIDSADAAGGDR